mmetsp:Transcript_39170/g.44668  ORF Transcript_39170/g.44668 Transcript_39170/m.44668 type:complete len:305 (+) Transcript_39170:123-1037(+)
MTVKDEAISKVVSKKDNNNDENDIEDDSFGDIENNCDRVNGRLFPDAFYCPTTNEIFQDPVVSSDGISYEKSAVEEGDNSSSLFYPNRALKEVIEEAKEHNGIYATDSVTNSLLRLRKSFTNNFDNILDGSIISLGDDKKNRPLPDVYNCPITFDIIHNPVIDKDGTTYGRRAIVKWIKRNGKSPTTREEASINDLYPNNAIRDLILEELNKSEDSIHPSIRKWKEQKQQEDDEVSSDDDDSVPITQDEITERERRLNRATNRKGCILLVLSFFLVVVYAFTPYEFSLLIIILLLVICKYIYSE